MFDGLKKTFEKFQKDPKKDKKNDLFALPPKVYLTIIMFKGFEFDKDNAWKFSNKEFIEYIEKYEEYLEKLDQHFESISYSFIL